MLNYLISDHWCIYCQYWLDTSLIFISGPVGGWQTGTKKIQDVCLNIFRILWRQTKFFVVLMSRKIWNWQNRRQLMSCPSKLMFRTILTVQLTIPKTGLRTQALMIGKNVILQTWWNTIPHIMSLFFNPLNFTMSHCIDNTVLRCKSWSWSVEKWIYLWAMFLILLKCCISVLVYYYGCHEVHVNVILCHM